MRASIITNLIHDYEHPIPFLLLTAKVHNTAEQLRSAKHFRSIENRQSIFAV
jgi:hypothetical protein